MILRLFSSNQPLLLIAIPVVVAAGLSPALAGSFPVIYHTGYPGESWLYSLEQNPFIHWLSAIILISSGALTANKVFNRHEFHSSAVYVPGLIYALLGVLFCLHGISLSALLANVFVLGGIDQVLRIYRQHRALSEYFKAGIMMGLAALLFPPLLVLAAASWIAILYTRSFVWREYVVTLLAFSVPFIWWLGLRYIVGAEGPPILLFRTILINWYTEIGEMGWWEKIALLLSVVSFLFGLPRFISPRSRLTNRARNIFTVFLLFGGSIVLAFMLHVIFTGEWNMIPLLVPFTFVLGLWYTNYRYSLMAPFVFYAWLLALILRIIDVSGILG